MVSESVTVKRRAKGTKVIDDLIARGHKESGKEDIFNNEVLDDEMLITQGALSKGLKGSIFTPKIVDGPRQRRSLTNTTNIPQTAVPSKKRASNKTTTKAANAEESDNQEGEANVKTEKPIQKRAPAIPAVVAAEIENARIEPKEQKSVEQKHQVVERSRLADTDIPVLVDVYNIMCDQIVQSCL